MDKMISRILNNITSKRDKFMLIEDFEYQIDSKQFHDIKLIPSDTKIAFVDGGCMEVLRAPSWSLFFNRVYHTIYKNNKRLASKRFEFFNYIFAVNEKNKIHYRTEYSFLSNQLDLPNYQFDSYDKSIVSNGRRAPVSALGNVIRRFAELVSVKEIDNDTVVILDGTLEPVYTYEKKLMDDLNSRMLCSLAKTSDILTDDGNSLTPVLRGLAEKDKWYYYVGKLDKVSIYFVKLHPRSEYVFRFESSSEDVEQVLSLLSENSRDPILLGYPYGLIDADKNARVSKKELDSLQIQIFMKLGRQLEKIKPYLNSLNAHDILDSIG